MTLLTVNDELSVNDNTHFAGSTVLAQLPIDASSPRRVPDLQQTSYEFCPWMPANSWRISG
ncbi:hypothetical protein BURMUCF2_B0503 [Burkholderia multivorans CF2]|nr:hypothetical protein BURMUCF2_B0503 [Burkholderia multivorans CF2]